jgi:HAD superfamily hydrolase (TIGR01549 family)
LRDLVPVFDLDGTLLDSDRALVAPFLALGVPEERVTFGLTLAEACAREGITIDQFLAAYDGTGVAPFPGVDELLRALPRWAVCSNKLGTAGRRELDGLGWTPEVALFVEDFGGSKTLPPVLDALGLAADEVVYVGDSDHDRVCAREAGAIFALGGWNARVTPAPDDVVLREPADLLPMLGRSRPA